MTNQEFYERVDEICNRLHDVGLSDEAHAISYRLHKAAWTTTSELFQELESQFRSILASSNAAKLPQEVKDDLAAYITMLDRVIRS